MAISQVTPTLYLSGLDAVNPHALARRRVTLLVNATEELSCPELDGVECVRVPVRDVPHARLDRHFTGVSERIRRNESGSSLVCCSAGRSRSPALVMAYLVLSEGLSLHEAHLRVLTARPFIRPNAGFWRQLVAFEQQVRQSSSVRMVSTSQGVLPEAVGQQESTGPVNVYDARPVPGAGQGSCSGSDAPNRACSDLNSSITAGSAALAGGQGSIGTSLPCTAYTGLTRAGTGHSVDSNTGTEAK